MTFYFTKMHGLGNDFIVVDATTNPMPLGPAQLSALSRRDTGIGFDQCLVLEKSTDPQVDFFYRIFNADGQEVGQCGNGARCLARFIERQGKSHKKNLSIQTASTKLMVHLHDDHTVTVDFSTPHLTPAAIPLATEHTATWYKIPLQDETITFHAIYVGNPHAVLIVDDVTTAAVARIGSALATHPFFPEQTNVGFMQIISPEHIKLRVYERGCGETQACGSGAVAAMMVGKLFHSLKNDVRVSLPGGDLYVSWSESLQAPCLRGPASFVYSGQVVEDN